MNSVTATRQTRGRSGSDSRLRQGALRTVTVRDFEGLVPHWAAWDRLAWIAPQAIPTLFPAWVDAYMRHQVGQNEQWFCSFVYDHDRLIGMIPVVIAAHPVLGRRWPLLQTLGPGPFSPSGDILLDADHSAAALQALLAEVSRQSPRHLGLYLNSVHQDSPLLRNMDLISREYASHIYLEPTFPYSIIDVRGDYDNWLSSIGNMRRNLKRYRKKLEAHGPVSVEIRTGAAAGEDFLTEFLALEASGWKGRGGTAILKDPNLFGFCTTLVKNLAAQQRLEWHIIRVQDRVVAAEMGIRCGTSLMLPKIAFDEGFAHCAPGSLLTGEIIRDAFRRPELHTINHMSDAEWHKPWRMSKYNHGHVHIVRRSAPAMLFQLPRIVSKYVYQHHIHPRIPTIVKKVREDLRRRREPKSRAQANGARTPDSL